MKTQQSKYNKMVETGHNIIETIVVVISASISWFFGWLPSGQMLGNWDKSISILAGIVAIIVGIHAIVNYWRKWNKK